MKPLYGGHLSIADTLSRNQLSQAMVKSLHSKPFYTGHLPIADDISEKQRGSQKVWIPISGPIFSKFSFIVTIDIRFRVDPTIYYINAEIFNVMHQNV